MDMGSILIGLALAIAVATFVARPLIQGEGEKITEVDRRLSELQAERDRVLSRIQELDMDFTMGKIMEEHYHSQRDVLMLYGAEILKELDVKAGMVSTPKDPVALDDEIEAAVVRIRTQDGSKTPVSCPTCNEAVQKGDRFCTHCGTPLKQQEVRE